MFSEGKREGKPGANVWAEVHTTNSDKRGRSSLIDLVVVRRIPRRSLVKIQTGFGETLLH